MDVLILRNENVLNKRHSVSIEVLNNGGLYLNGFANLDDIFQLVFEV